MTRIITNWSQEINSKKSKWYKRNQIKNKFPISLWKSPLKDRCDKKLNPKLVACLLRACVYSDFTDHILCHKCSIKGIKWAIWFIYTQLKSTPCRHNDQQQRVELKRQKVNRTNKRTRIENMIVVTQEIHYEQFF